MVDYWLDLFTPEAWEEARERGFFGVTGFRLSRWPSVSRIKPDDIFICYVTRLSRFCGVLKATSEPYKDEEKARQIWKHDFFPFLIDVEPLVTFDFLHSVPRSEIVPKLSIANKWGGIIRASPSHIPFPDGEQIKNSLEISKQRDTEYPILKKTTGKRHKKRIHEKPDRVIGESNRHDAILQSLITIGEIFGYKPMRKPTANDLRPPDQPFKGEGKTLDLAWKIVGLTHIPFEVQVHGSVPDLMYRLNLVHQWSLKIVIVADQKWHEEIKEAAQVYPFAGKLVMLTLKDIDRATKDYVQLRDLREKIFT